jgi:hypothetical protein
MREDTMETVNPEGLSEMARSSQGAACDCMCSLDQRAGAEGGGLNSDSCGCFCSGGLPGTNNANKGGANNKLSGVFAAFERIDATLKALGSKK